MKRFDQLKVMWRNQSTNPLLLPAYLLWRRAKKRDKAFSPAASAANILFSQPSFSQYGEDLILSSLFDGTTNGTYVDVGSFHPYLISNTYLLYRRGWTGINIDPNPRAVRSFVRHRPRDTTLQLAVTAQEGTVPFQFNGVFSAISDGTEMPDNTAIPSVEVPARPLSSILDSHLPNGKHIDLLDVDCEGHDLEVLRSNDWNRYRPSVVLAEWQDDESRREIVGYLDSLEFNLVVALHMTGVFVSKGYRRGDQLS